MPAFSLDAPALLIVAFVAVVAIGLVVDLGVVQRRPHAAGTREALAWTAVWISLAVAFGIALTAVHGTTKGVEFLTGYLIEYSLSVDNVFVFTLVFTAFAIPGVQQHRLLFWGVLGALVMRLVMIVVGAALIERAHWVMLIFGALLLVTAYRMLKSKPETSHDPSGNLLVRIVRRFVPVERSDNGRFVLRRDGRLVVTPLLLALLVIESSDLLFAIDSIPAVFAVTTDPLIVYTSNTFAILGLRSLAVLVASGAARLRYLRVGLAVVLGFVGVKLLISEFVYIPALLSLGVVGATLAVATLASLAAPVRGAAGKPAAPRDRDVEDVALSD